MRFLYTSVMAVSVLMLGALSVAQIADAAPVARSAHCPQISQTVVRGDSGTKALEVQKFLSDYYHLAPTKIQTGYYGAVTQAYVIKYQKEKGLPVFGVVGPLTLKSIKNVCKSADGIQSPGVCTGDAMQCSDGSYVSRHGPSCAFDACPSGQQVSPTVLSISPTAGPVDTKVSIKGTRFTKSDNRVNFGGSVYPGLVSDNDGTMITFNIPSSSNPPCRLSNPPCMIAAMITQPGQYPVSVTNINGTSNKVTFSVTDRTSSLNSPTITSISPTSGPLGTSITITGTGFALGGGTFSSGGQMFVSDPIAIDSQITFRNKSTGSVYSVNSPQRSTDGTTLNFTLTACPPPVAYTGDAMTMACSGVYIPAGEYSVTVKNDNGPSNAVFFTVTNSQTSTPTITSLSPTLGTKGSLVTITGTNFTATGNTVNFGNNVYPTQTSSNGTGISFTVPFNISPACLFTSPRCAIDAPIQPDVYSISVTNANGTSNSATFTIEGTMQAI